MTLLHQIQDAVHLRTREIASADPAWPCRKGCDDCCRSLASAPRITEAEWRSIAAALEALPAPAAESARRRIETSASASRPIVCPLLDTVTGACLVYDARPIACRAYGFYAERESVLGCHRIEAVAAESPGVIWGNHTALEERLGMLGPAATLAEWLTRFNSHQLRRRSLTKVN
jgi:Fe-S-cluster containining protein